MKHEIERIRRKSKPRKGFKLLQDGQGLPDLPEDENARRLVLDLIAAASDVALLVNKDGQVELTRTNTQSGLAGRETVWTGQHLRALFADESWAKLSVRLDNLRDGPALELNHSAQAGYEFPVRYTVCRLGTKGQILLMGRDLRPIAEVQQQLVLAHRAIGRDHEAQRELETRYRVLMEENSSPILIIAASTGRIVDLNSTSARLLGAQRNDLLNAPVAQEFEGRRRGELLESLTKSAMNDTNGNLELSVRRTGQRVQVNTKLFRASGDRLLLCRISLSDSAQTQNTDRGNMLEGLFEKGIDGIVFLDGNGLVKSANESFLKLTDSHSQSVVIDRSFADFLSRGAVDLKVLLDNVKRVGHIRHYRTRLNTDYMGEVSVELSATLLQERGKSLIAIVLRDSVVSDRIVWPNAMESNDGLRNVMRLVGYSALKDIVAETTEIIEKMCIEAALEMSGNNRAAAAELLSLSRQSLYVKLRKFGVLSKDAE